MPIVIVGLALVTGGVFLGLYQGWGDTQSDRDALVSIQPKPLPQEAPRQDGIEDPAASVADDFQGFADFMSSGAHQPSPYVLADVAASNAAERALSPDGTTARERTAARRASMQLTEDELKAPSSELAVAVGKSPLSVRLFLQSTLPPDMGLSLYADVFNAVPELLSRDDAFEALISRYREIGDQVENEEEGIKQYALQFTIFEIMLGAETVLEGLSNSQLEYLISSVLRSWGQREAYNQAQPEPVFGKSLLAQGALPVAKAMLKLEVPAYLNWRSLGENQDIYESRAGTYSEAIDIMQTAQDWIEKQP